MFQLPSMETLGSLKAFSANGCVKTSKNNPLNLVSRSDPLDYHLNFLDFSSLQDIDMQKPWPNG